MLIRGLAASSWADDGAASSEYAVLIALVSAVVVLAVTALGVATLELYDSDALVNALVG